MNNTSDFIIENGVLKKYVGPDGDVVIPEGVTAISDRVFSYKKHITSVVIPAGVTKIGESAFGGCSNLETVILPEGLEILSSHAFEKCSSLRYIEIPNSVTYLGTMVFADCGIEEAVMPLKTKHSGFLPRGIFSGCKNLRKVSFTTDVDPLRLPLVLDQRSTFDECPLEAIYAPLCPISSLSHYKPYAAAGYAEMILSGKQLDPQIADSYDRYLKSQRKKLRPFAITRMGLLHLMLKRRLYSHQEAAEFIELAVQNGASEAAAALLEYQSTFTDQQKALEEDEAMSQMMKVPSELELLKRDWKTSYTEEGICLDMYKASRLDVVIPKMFGRDMVTEIGEFALSPKRKRCPEEQREVNAQIQSVEISENVKVIRKGAFAGCAKLSSVTFAGPVPQIGPAAFGECTLLADTDGFIIVDNTLCGYVGNHTHVQIPHGVLVIAGAFADQPAICSFSIPDTVTRIDEESFMGCKKLKELIVPANVEVFCIDSIAHCTKLKKLVFRSAKTKVTSSAIWLGNVKPTIYAPKDSYAETYAKNSRIPFVAE